MFSNRMLIPLTCFCIAVALGGDVLASDVDAVVPRIDLAAPDPAQFEADDDLREALGLPPRFAHAERVQVSPQLDGHWDALPDGTLRWRLRITAPGAKSLNFGFTRFQLPKNAILQIREAETARRQLRFTAAHNAAHGELWTPVVRDDDVLLELVVPPDQRDAVQLELTAINLGYKDLETLTPDKAGSCNIDVACGAADAWRDQTDAVALYSLNGVFKCTGFLVNNTARDLRPLFQTAFHCGVDDINDASVVVYWQFQRAVCEVGSGVLDPNMTQSGATLLARAAGPDFALLLLDDTPPAVAGVYYAGWDRDPNDPLGAVTIHHPSLDEKSISFEFDPTTTTTYLDSQTPGAGTHIRVADWDLGTTEGGSSGAPLFKLNGLVAGQLHGGFAACSNTLPDWYGRLSQAWNWGGSSAGRLRDWLDPVGDDPMSLAGLRPADAAGLVVTPAEEVTTSVLVGAYSPVSYDFQLANTSDATINVRISASEPWVTLSQDTGVVAPGGLVNVNATLHPAVALLPAGRYVVEIEFENETTGVGSSTRRITLLVGEREPIVTFPLDSDPGWTTEGDWAFGTPTGEGGSSGFSDPMSGATGPFVYGNNLSGDYENNIGAAQHLTTNSIDAANYDAVELRYARYLNVESSRYDFAGISVSVNGAPWVDVWRNAVSVTDSAWRQEVVDLDGLVDGSSDVRIRWGLGPTDTAITYAGWNIDDIALWGIARGATIDCNTNGVHDPVDIALGTSLDVNNNGVPDECDPALLGDLNCDGFVNTQDIDGFVLALVNEDAYRTQYPDCSPDNADCNQDGAVNAQDIDAFVQFVVSGGR